MKTPVVIAALNEERNIGRTLDTLPRDLTEPIVVVNGSSDNTAAIARRFTDQVYDLPEQGKMPAIQFAMKRLGNRALDPFIVLDADSAPIFPRHWSDAMVKNITPPPFGRNRHGDIPTSDANDTRAYG
jgi:glycosyltransferase involved in cell wall biosynthesis